MFFLIHDILHGARAKAQMASALSSLRAHARRVDSGGAAFVVLRPREPAPGGRSLAIARGL